jgi:hypothetical protein
VKYEAFCEEKGVQAEDILNFDEAGFRVGVTCGEDIIVPADIKEVRTSYFSILFFLLTFYRQYIQLVQKIENL